MSNEMKKLIILAGVAIVLALVAFVILPKVTQKKEHDGGPKLFELNEAKVKKFRLDYYDTNVVVTKKGNNEWRVYPGGYETEPDEVLANIKNFNTMMIQQPLSNVESPKEYGLDEPVAEFSIWGDDKHTFTVGDMTFDSNAYYVAYNGNYFAVEKWYVLALMKPVDDFRKKDFLSLDMNDIVRVELGETLSFEKVSVTDWKCNRIKTNLNVRRVLHLVQSIGMLRAEGYAPEGSEPRAYLLDPGYIIKVDLIDKTFRLFHVSKAGEKAFARNNHEKTIYEIGPTFYELVTKPLDYYVRSSNDVVTNEGRTNRAFIPPSQP